MPELIKLNGSAVNALSCIRREVAQPDGPALEEYQMAVMLRGRMTHRSFATLLEAGTIRVEFGSGDTRDTSVTAASVTSTGGGESAVYRHDFTLRETPVSATRRATETAQENARLAAAVAELNVLVADVEEKDGEGSGDTWATALQKLQSAANGSAPRPDPAAGVTPGQPPIGAHPPPPPADLLYQATRSASPQPVAAPVPPVPSIQPASPQAAVAPQAAVSPAPSYPAARPAVAAADGSLTPTEIAGIEAVLVGLRLEAIIDALDRLQIMPRDEIEQAFLRLVQKRFVAEASLVVGEPVARRAARDILQGLGVGRWALGVSGDR